MVDYTLTATQIRDALKLVEGGEYDVTVIGKKVGCDWEDFMWCEEQVLVGLADGYDWWLNYGQYET